MSSDTSASESEAKEELEAIRSTIEGLPNALARAAQLNEGLAEDTTLDIRALHLVRLAALAASGAPPIAFRVNLEAMDDHVSVEDVDATLSAIAPIIGTARYLSAVRSILED
ncbi:MAG: carboxymuconolactone decarboxylase family protein [Microthrixaceae bacterium]|nr:carboxymuconolactone decarboxylase family protein [Microthrixaceae bacterium]